MTGWTSPPGSCSAARPCCCSSACRSRSPFSSSTSSAPGSGSAASRASCSWRATRVSSVTSFSLTPIPLFVLMGEILFHTGLAVKVIDGIERLIAQVPGRLAVVAVVAGTVFSAISGSTIATTAMLGSLMVPVMLSRGYHPTLATGPVMAIGAVDMLIPPSALTVLLGSLSGISISKLLIGGVVPGLLLSLAFVAWIIVRVRITPSLAPQRRAGPPSRLRPLQAVPALRAAAGLDLRRGRRRDGGGLGHAHRVGRGRRAGDDRARARLPGARAGRSCSPR